MNRRLARLEKEYPVRSDRTRAQRLAVTYMPRSLDAMPDTRKMWYEEEEDIERGITYGMEKAALLRWVRAQMARRLTPRERRCIEMYYLKSMTYEQIGRHTHTNKTSALRAVTRGLRKLRAAKEQDFGSGRVRRSVTRSVPRRGGRGRR